MQVLMHHPINQEHLMPQNVIFLKGETVTYEKRVLKLCKVWLLISLRVLLFTTSFRRNVLRENAAKKL